MLINAVDPGGTSTIRKRFSQEIHKRWNIVKKAAKKEILKDPNRVWTQEAVYFLLRDLAERHVMSIENRRFLLAAYFKGLKNANRDIRRDLKVRLPSDGFSTDEKVFRSIHHLDTFESALTQSYEDLNKQVLLVAVLGSELFIDKFQETQDINISFGVVDDRINKIGKTRGTALANWFVVGLAAKGILNRAIDAGIERVMARTELVFTTAGDVNVCIECQALEKNDNGFGPGVYLVEDAFNIIPVHVGCRCTWNVVSAGIPGLIQRSLIRRIL